ncbi:hypothetical protein B0H10DRAFT_714687 [Mycena sp. CBHHK59/15]|nr:hypothetical protein B0H10DRAFT_714687 [Mycena sp. CBHHK59/15]
MRNLKPRNYQSVGFQTALEDSGLLESLHEICRLGNLLETSHPDIERSFRYHNWKISYGELICDWTPATITIEEYERPDPKYKFTPEDAMELFVFISSHPRMHPWAHNPMAAYLLLSLDCFTINCDTWLVPCLETLNYPRIVGWNSEKGPALN